jgi:DNA-binding NtrC family response regulator
MMPEMDGVSLLKAAREVDGNLAGIVMTGQGTIDTAVQAMQHGALDYILKTFKLSAILPVLARASAATSPSSSATFFFTLPRRQHRAELESGCHRGSA